MTGIPKELAGLPAAEHQASYRVHVIGPHELYLGTVFFDGSNLDNPSACGWLGEQIGITLGSGHREQCANLAAVDADGDPIEED